MSHRLLRLLHSKTSRGSPLLIPGIILLWKLTLPISTEIEMMHLRNFTGNNSTQSVYLKRARIHFLLIEKYLANIRRPFPLFSASLPSGLRIRRPKSAFSEFKGPTRMPSEPSQNCDDKYE